MPHNVKHAWRYRLFRYGKMPTALTEAKSAPDVLFAAEGVSILSKSRSIRVPGLRSARGATLLVGSLVVSPHRLLAAVGPYVILDHDFASSGREGQTLTLAADDIRLALDVASVLEGGSGHIELDYRAALDPGELAQLPTAPVAVAVSDAVGPLLRTWA
jgi:hypothetical protein